MTMILDPSLLTDGTVLYEATVLIPGRYVSVNKPSGSIRCYIQRGSIQSADGVPYIWGDPQFVDNQMSLYRYDIPKSQWIGKLESSPCWANTQRLYLSDRGIVREPYNDHRLFTNLNEAKDYVVQMLTTGQYDDLIKRFNRANKAAGYFS